VTSTNQSQQKRVTQLPERHRPPTGLGLVAALAAWVALLVVLNITVQPLVAFAAFVGLCALALRADQRRLIVLSLIVGAGLLLVMPGLSLTSGSWSFTFGAKANWLPPVTPVGIATAVMSLLRVPAQVLAITLLALVPSTELLHGLARVSPRSALLGGLAARMRPLMRNDARLLNDELRSRGLVADRHSTLAARVRSLSLLWSSLIAGAFDRAEITAQTLAERGYGATRTTTAQLQHVQLRPRQRTSKTVDRLVMCMALLVVLLAIGGRVSGQLLAPNIQVFAGIHDAVTPMSLLLAMSVGLLTLVPARLLTRPGCRAGPAGAARPARQASCIADCRQGGMHWQWGTRDFRTASNGAGCGRARAARRAAADDCCWSVRRRGGSVRQRHVDAARHVDRGYA